MLFAKIDVCFWRHPKFIEAGLEACGYWAGCLTWLRENDSADGIVPDSLLGHILDVGSKKASQICTKLVVVGLFEREANGYHLLRYEDKNETKEEIEARKERSRERSSKWRAAKVISVPPPADGDASLTRSSQGCGDALVPDSGSGSGSGSVSSGISVFRLPDHIVRLEGKGWVAAYTTAVDESRGDGRKYALRDSPNNLHTLKAAIETHCPPDERPSRDKWLAQAVRDFMRAQRFHGWEPRRSDRCGPDALLDWLNERQAPKIGAKSAQTTAHVEKREDDEPIETANLSALGRAGVYKPSMDAAS